MNDWLNIYGRSFSFTIFHKQKYNTLIGLVCSIGTIILMFIFAFFFGKELVLKENPHTIYSKNKPSNYTYYNITPDIFYFPWRINDRDGNPVEFQRLVYPFLHYEKYIRDPITRKVHYTTEVLKYSKCKPNPKYSLKANEEVENYSCFDFDQLKIGGGYEADEYYFLSLYFSYCPVGYIYDPKTCNQKDLIELFNILGGDSGWYFSFIYPEHNFEPITRKEPLRIIYRIFSQKLNVFTIKTHQFTFQFAKITDDQGFLAASEEKYRKFATHDVSSDYQPLDFLFEGSSTIFYKLSLAMNKDNDEYYRRYIKLPEVLANIGGILKIVMFVFEMICLLVHDSFLYASLLCFFFDFEEKKVLHKAAESNLPMSTSAANLNLNKKAPSLIPMINALVTPFSKTGIDLSIRAEIKKDAPKKKHWPFSCGEACSSPYSYIAKYIMFELCFTKSVREVSKQYLAFSRAFNAFKSRIEVTEYIRLINESDILMKEMINDKLYKNILGLRKVNPLNGDDVNYVYRDLLKGDVREKAKS